MDFELINWKLISHPVNWGIVWVTLLFAAFAYTVIHDGIVNAANNQAIIPD